MAQTNVNRPPSLSSEQPTGNDLPRSSAFVTLMMHFYRGEISRANIWRTRLDATTNWAVVTTGAVLTFAFSTPEHPHIVILISLLLIWIFLVIETRRYRYYELSALRVRLLETNFVAGGMDGSLVPQQDWPRQLVDSLLSPRFPVGFWEAIGRRLRRNYIWLFLILGVSWAVKLGLYPDLTISWSAFLSHAAVGLIPGKVVVLLVGAFYVMTFLLAFLTLGLRASPGEILSESDLLEYPSDLFIKIGRAAREVVHRHEQLVMIITDHPNEVGDLLLSTLKRGVTAIEGRGMYSGKARSILFCAVQPDEISRIKSTVHAADGDAFVVVNPTDRVWGGGFGDLRPDWSTYKGAGGSS